MEGQTMSVKREFGGSLPVENVQNLAAKLNSKEIPSRYIRPEIDNNNVVTVDDSLHIPVIDMAKLSHHEPEEMATLHQACREWGFFQLVNHGAGEVIEEMKVATGEFFGLPLDEKKRSAQRQNDLEGYGQAFVVSDDQKLDWGDMLYLLPLPVQQRNMSLWPQNPPKFRPTLHNYSEELSKIALKLITWMAINLGIESHGKLTSDFEDCMQGIRMNYYPTCAQADKVIGLTPHSDATGLTLLVQANEVQGLQIKKDGKWVPIQPVSGAIIVNIGDVLEIMSNGEYKSIEHRAVVNFEKERLSIASFHSPNLKAIVRPLPELAKTSGEKYKTLSMEEFVRQAIATKLNGKSLLDQMKIER